MPCSGPSFILSTLYLGGESDREVLLVFYSVYFSIILWFHNLTRFLLMDIWIISSFLVLKFKSSVYFVFTLASGVRWGSRLLLLPVVVWFSQHRVLRPPFPPLSVLGSLVKH